MEPAYFTLDARRVVHLRGPRGDASPITFEIALLTSGPTPEGSHGTELPTVPGYMRQLAVFDTMTANSGPHSTLRNTGRVMFGPLGDEWPSPTHAAIYEQGGDAPLFYGTLQLAELRAPAENGIIFEPSSIQLRYR